LSKRIIIFKSNLKSKKIVLGGERNLTICRGKRGPVVSCINSQSHIAAMDTNGLSGKADVF